MTTPLQDAQAMVAAYMKAEAEVLLGKEVRLGGPGIDRWMRMEDLPAIRDGRKEWERKVASLQGADAGTPTFGGLSFSVARFDGSTNG